VGAERLMLTTSGQNLLAYHFPISENYGVEREAYTRGPQTRGNVCVDTLTHGSMSMSILTENKKASMSQSAHPPPIGLTKASTRSLRPRSFISAALAGKYGPKIGKHLLRSVSATSAASCTFYCRKIFSSSEYLGSCRGSTLLFGYRRLYALGNTRGI
jgi:hypothetical protein